MSIQQFFGQIAQGQYEAFREYLNTGENGRPVTILNLAFELRRMPYPTVSVDRNIFLKHLFEALKPITTQTSLDLSFNDIDDAGAAVIANGLKTNTKLTSLDLSRNDIGDAGADAIANGLKTNTTLTSLDLSNNDISDAGAYAIAKGLMTNTTLTSLNLSDNDNIEYEDATAAAFAEILNTNITEKEVLDEVYRLWPQPITEAFAQHFTLINNEAANVLIDPKNDISRGLAYVQRRRLTEDNEKRLIEENKRHEQAQSRESAQETPLNIAPASNDSQNTSQTFALGKRNKEQDNSAKRPRTRYQNISKREAEEINKEAKVFCGEIKAEGESKRKLRARK